MNTEVVESSLLPDAPYRGITSYRYADQQIFPEREEETWALYSKVILYSGVLFFGDSGSGKSSLLNAGLVPQALEQGYVPDRLRVQPVAGREIKIERMRKSDTSPFSFLPSNFTPDPATNGDCSEAESFELSLTEFQRQLERFRITDNAAGTDLSMFGYEPTPGPRALLVFDQFEEFITLFEEAQRGGPTTAARKARREAPGLQLAIRDALVKLIQDDGLRTKVVFSFREDFFPKLGLLFDLCPNLLDQSQRLVPPSVDSVPKLIRAPFVKTELRTHYLSKTGDREAGSEISDELARQVAKKLVRRAESDTVNLTELQIVCLRLWQSDDPEQLFRRSGVEGILKDFVAARFYGIKPELRDAAAILLSHMITGQNTRNIVSENDLLARSSEHRLPATSEQLREALDALCRNQIVRRDLRRNLYVYELVSEYAVPWINELVSNRKAIELSLETRETRVRLADQRLRAWHELRRTRLLRRLLIACGSLVIVLIGVIVFALYQYQSLKRARLEHAASEEKARLIREQQDKYSAAFKVIVGNDAEKLAALNKIKYWTEKSEFPSELGVLVSAQVSSKNPAIQQVATEILRKTVQNNPALSPSIEQAADTNSNLADKLPPRFYIHIADESQRPAAQRIAAALKTRGWLVPGIQNVGVKAPIWNNELRRAPTTAPGMPEATDVLPVLDSANIGKWSDTPNKAFEPSAKTRPGHFELWFAGPKGQLNINFVDEFGGPLQGVRPTTKFAGITANVRSFSSRAVRIWVPPGDYEVTILVPGFKEIKRPLSIQAGAEVYWSDLTLVKDSR